MTEITNTSETKSFPAADGASCDLDYQQTLINIGYHNAASYMSGFVPFCYPCVNTCPGKSRIYVFRL